MAQVSATPTTEVRVEYDQACIGCGYALRGLPVTGVCPECGTPVARSFRGDRLSAADPEYVRTLLQGATLLLGAAVVALLVLIGGTGAAVLIDTGRNVSSVAWKLPLFAGLATMAATCVAGAFKISAHDPEGLDRPAQHVGRAMVRPGAAVAAAGGLTAVALELAAAGSDIAAGIAIAVWLLGMFAMAIGLALVIRSIARRSGERRLAKKLRTSIVFFALGGALLAGPRLVGPFVGVGVGSLLSIIAVAYGFGLLEEIRSALKRDAAAAQLRRMPARPGPDTSAPAGQPTAPPITPRQPFTSTSGTLH
jgi:predicted RNA-binding Zn-ribbon protein involved in translation (DUF1610 family)